jgi:hypothetical protein
LTDEQEKQIDDLEKEVGGRIDKILSTEQRRILDEARPRAGGPPNGSGGRPGRGGKRPDRPSRPGDPPPPPFGGSNDFDGPAPPSGPREWHQAADSLNLTGRQKENTDEVFEMLHKKLHQQHEQAQADLLRQMKMVLNDQQFQQFAKALR